MDDKQKFMKYLEVRGYEEKDLDGILDFIGRNYPELKDNERVIWLSICSYIRGFDSGSKGYLN